jgi:hypothetical protein
MKEERKTEQLADQPCTPKATNTISELLKDAHDAYKFSHNHKAQLEKDSVCGCFYCKKIFDPSEINEWMIEDNPCDRLGTAVCPYCDIDSVIGESSGYPITEEFLSAMHRVWFS